MIEPANKSGRRSEFIIVAVGIALVLVVLVAISVLGRMNESLFAAELEIQIAARDLAVAHLWYEEVIGGDASVDIEKDVYAKMDDTAAILHALLDGTSVGGLAVYKESEADARALLDLMLASMVDWRRQAVTRWSNKATSQPGSDADSKFDATFTELQRLTNAYLEHLGEVKVRHEIYALAIDGVLVALVLAQTLVVYRLFRNTRLMDLRNRAELEETVLKRTEELRLEMAVRGSIEERNRGYSEEMSQLYNELATTSRESNRSSRALKKALAELKEAQSKLVQQEKMTSLGQMTAGIAHEINNPIAFIAGNHTTLMRDFKDLLGLINIVGDSLEEIGQSCPSVHERIVAKVDEIDLHYLAEVIPKKIANNEDGLERVKQIVLDLRTFSRLDDDGFKPCDVAENILASLRFLAPLTQAHGVEIETHLAASPPLLCAPGLLNQAISNIVTNAVQASRKGERVLVSTRSDESEFVVEVQDHGSGISPEDLPKIFDPFFTTKPVGTGTGMGLGITLQIVKAHHGEIEIDSTSGKGTTFRIRLPRRLGDAKGNPSIEGNDMRKELA